MVKTSCLKCNSRPSLALKTRGKEEPIGIGRTTNDTSGPAAFPNLFAVHFDVHLRAANPRQAVMPTSRLQILANRLREENDFGIRTVSKNKSGCVLDAPFRIAEAMDRLGKESQLKPRIVRIPEFMGRETPRQLPQLPQSLRLLRLRRGGLGDSNRFDLQLLRPPLIAERSLHDNKALAGQHGGMHPAVGPLRPFVELQESERSPRFAEGPQRAVLVGAGRISKSQQWLLNQLDFSFRIAGQPRNALLHVPGSSRHPRLFLGGSVRALFAFSLLRQTVDDQA